MKQMGIRFFSIAVAMGLFILIGGMTAYAEEQKSIRTDVEFGYKVNEKSGDAIPAVNIFYSDYANNYNGYRETYTFEELTIKKPSSGELIVQTNMHTYNVYNMKDSSKVYWNNLYKIKSTSETYISILYEFDKETKKLKVMKEVTGKGRYNGRIEFFPLFQGYAINEDTYHGSSNNIVEIYTLPSNELIGKVGYVRTESDSFSLDGQLHAYTQIPAPKTLIVGKYEKMIGYYGQEYIGGTPYEMSKTGTMKKLIERPQSAKILWEKKVGSITYAHYYDDKKKQWFIGNKTSGKSSYTPLTKVGTEGEASFSPNNKYLIITQYSLDEKTKKRASHVTLVYDANKGKLLYELPAYDKKIYKSGPFVPHMYYWTYGDEMVRVYFFDYRRAAYLNLSSGIITSSYSDTGLGNSISYTGNYGELLSPEKSPELMLDGQTRITLPAQGAFLSDKYDWYVGLRDFSNAIGGTISIENGKITLSRMNKSMIINPDSIISFKNKSYVPIKELRSGLGLKLQINAPETFTN